MTIQSARQKNLLLIVGGIAAGFINGLLGAGGGILLVFIMGIVLPSEEGGTAVSASPDKRDIFANALAAMLPVTVISVISYASRGDIHLEGAETYVFPAVIGGIGGAWLLDRLRFETVRRMFAILVIVSGIAMLLKD